MRYFQSRSQQECSLIFYSYLTSFNNKTTKKIIRREGTEGEGSKKNTQNYRCSKICRFPLRKPKRINCIRTNKTVH